MKNKAPLALMEQLIMLVIFALAAALCLQVYVLSGQISRRCQAQAQAVTVVQSTAEILKAANGDREQLSVLLGGSGDTEQWSLYYNEDWAPTAADQASYQILVTPAQTETPALGGASISAFSETEELFGITVFWQEVF